MPRGPRSAPGGYVYHVINRGVARLQLFANHEDYRIFEECLFETRENLPMRICGWCVMPNHWHLVLWPEEDGDLSRFMHWLTTTHVSRLKKSWEVEHTGHIYQGRFKSFPVQTENYYFNLLRYIEANPLRARLVDDAGNWRWSSLWYRLHQKVYAFLQSPISLPSDWINLVNQPLAQEATTKLCYSMTRCAPYGEEDWSKSTAISLNLLSTLRPRGRPRTPTESILEK
jgi:putative transposase